MKVHEELKEDSAREAWVIRHNRVQALKSTPRTSEHCDALVSASIEIANWG
jgi:hypothetical protein